MKKTEKIQAAMDQVEAVIAQTTEIAIEAAIDGLDDYVINPELYNAYKKIFQYIYPKVDINIWTPEIMEQIIIVSNDTE